MKHIVELKYTNPSHEHVSLRRRVETINRVVEAQSTEEALNRAANQQRALGFRIQSANIVEQKVEEPTTELISEETELEEGKVAKALAVGAMALASMGAKAHTDTTKSVDQLAKERPALAQRLHDIGASGQVPASDKRAAELQRKQDQEMPASERRAKELKKEEVALDEMDKSQPSSSRGAEGLALGKKADPVKTDKVKSDALKLLQKQYKKVKEEVESVNEDQAADMQKIQSMDKGSMVGGKTELKAHLKYLNAMHTHQKKYGLDTAKTKKKIGDVSRSLVQMGEEVEQIDEANMRFDPEAAARPKSSDVKNFLNRDKNPRAAAASKKYIRRMTKLGGLGPNQTKKDTEAHMKAHFEEVVTEAEREAGYKMPAHVAAAQKKFDTQAKGQGKMRPQAGTLAAAKMKKEAVDPGSMKVVNKKVKAAEKMINAAKGKVNRVDLKPTLDLDSPKE